MKKYKILLFVIVMSCISNVYMWGTTKPLSKEEFYKLKYCSTVVYMVPRA